MASEINLNCNLGYNKNGAQVQNPVSVMIDQGTAGVGLTTQAVVSTTPALLSLSGIAAPCRVQGTSLAANTLDVILSTDAAGTYTFGILKNGIADGVVLHLPTSAAPYAKLSGAGSATISVLAIKD